MIPNYTGPPDTPRRPLHPVPAAVLGAVVGLPAGVVLVGWDWFIFAVLKSGPIDFVGYDGLAAPYAAAWGAGFGMVLGAFLGYVTAGMLHNPSHPLSRRTRLYRADGRLRLHPLWVWALAGLVFALGCGCLSWLLTAH